MCGIFGYVGARTDAAGLVLHGLKQLEYRGYDSWGIAARQMGEPVAALEGFQQPADLVHHGVEYLGRDVPAAEPFGQRHHADRQRGPRDDMVRQPVRAPPGRPRCCRRAARRPG